MNTDLPFRVLLLTLIAPMALALLPRPVLAGNREQRQQVFTVEELRDRDTTRLLLDQVAKMIEAREVRLKKAKKADDDDLEDDLEDELEILEFTEAELKIAAGPAVSGGVVFETNSYADRILQTVERPVKAEFLPKPGIIFKNLVLGSLFGQPAPRPPRGGAGQPVGGKAAKRESVYLFRPGSGDFFTSGELAGLSPLEIAALDVSPGNPNWYDRNTFRKMQPDPLASFEAFLARGMTEALREDGDLDKGESYDIHAARKVFFLEEVYKSATSPKAHVEDAFGVEWKVKWGDEVAVEPLSGSLYLLAGAKMTDLTLTNGFGPDDMILILMDPEDAGEEREDADKDEKRYPATVEDLIAATRDLYGFRMDPYIHSRGTITKENVDQLLRHLPAGGKKKYRPKKLIGREWVAFRESSAELSAKGFIRRHDGSRVSDYVAVHDRASRGAYLFDMWISNRDVKSGNNKAYFVKELRGKDMEITGYREGHHDLGTSLGSLFSAGELNEVGIGREFVRKGLLGRPRFQQTVLFRPRAWDTATWSDCRWMAQNLANITESQLRKAVGRSGWPDFVQRAAAYRLLQRREEIVKLFGVTTGLSGSALEPPSVSIPLGNSAQIRGAERRYGLESGSLAAELRKAGAGAGHVEPVLVDGVLVDCKKSALIRLLTRQRYPSGLTTRYIRLGDREADCLREKP